MVLNENVNRLFIGGDWVAPSSDEEIEVISPSTEEVVARVPSASRADVDAAVAAARQAFDSGPWPQTTLAAARRGAATAARLARRAP